MALRGGNALNSGSARKSAKFVKAKKKPTIVTMYKGGKTLPLEKVKSKATAVPAAKPAASTLKKPTQSRKQKAQEMMKAKTSLKTRKRKK